MYELLRKNPTFGKLTGINLLSKIGDKLFYTALLSAAAAMEEASLAVLVVSVSETLPILFSFFLGGLADRKRRKTAHLIINSLIRGILYLSVFGLLYFQNSFLVIVGISLLNFCSDILGNYSAGLAAPFTKLLVKDEDLEQAQSFTNTGSQLINIMGNFLGSVLLSLFLMKDLALLNAGIFFAVGLGFYVIKKSLSVGEERLKVPDMTTSLVKSALNTLRLLYHQRKLFNDLLQLALMNGFFGGIMPIFVLFLAASQKQVFSTPITISIFSIVTTGLVIIGNILSPTFWQKTSNVRLANCSAIGIVLCAFGLFAQQMGVVLVGNAIVSFLTGLMAPRFSAQIVRYFPAELMGSVISTVNGILVIIPPITALLFPLLAMSTLETAYLGIVFYALLIWLINYFLKGVKKNQ